MRAALCASALVVCSLFAGSALAQGAPPPSAAAPEDDAPAPAPEPPTSEAPPPAQPTPAPGVTPAAPPAQAPTTQPPTAQPPYVQQPPGGPPPAMQPYPQTQQPYWGPPPPPQGPPPLTPEEPSCCRFGLRFDPFDLLFRRLSFQAELKLWGPLSIEAEPSWIFASATENLDTKGGALQGNFLVYFTGEALQGFYAKAIVGFEAFEATVTDPDLEIETSEDIASPILGLGIGSSAVFGDEVGFNLAGGIGIGFALAESKTVRAGRYEVSFYDKASVVQLIASLGLGVAF